MQMSYYAEEREREEEWAMLEGNDRAPSGIRICVYIYDMIHTIYSTRK